MTKERALPQISIIVPHLNQPDFLLSCLQSLREQGAEAEDVEIIVVDNGSKALPSQICDRFKNVSLISEAVPGPGPARNKGIETARAPLLAFIDADCFAGTGWLQAIKEKFRDTDIQVIGGDVRIALNDAAHVTQLEAYESVYAYRQKMYIEKQGFSGTGNLAMRREVYQDVGPFAGIGIAEDRDWGKRATRLGYKIHYCPEMKVYHPARKSFSELHAKWERHIAHDYAESERTLKWRVLWYAKAVALFFSPVWESVRIVQSDRLYDIKSRWLAWTGLCRIRFFRFKLMMLSLHPSRSKATSAKWNR